MEEMLLAESRLENINAVEPILSALRTVSHGTWQKAKVKAAAVKDYSRRIQWMTTTLLSSFSENKSTFVNQFETDDSTVLILALGSERGLCGQFNTAVLQKLRDFTVDPEKSGKTFKVWSIGSRFTRILSRGLAPPEWSSAFSTGALPSFSMASNLCRQLLDTYESGRIDEVLVVYNESTRSGTVETRQTKLIPPDPAVLLHFEDNQAYSSTSWPPPIIETDPRKLLKRLLGDSLTIRLYEYLLISTAAENATRFFLMEEATQNVERLIDELEVLVQLDRQQKITQEMGELAAGSGLIKVD